MPELKQQLTELIDAFAVARATGHETLIKQSATALVEFLESVQVTRPQADGSEEQGRDGSD